ncbi:bifunctional glutamine synthetase adenylyltransferase/deadenyltransferase [Vespertiliibacter pulmonis]|uniref:Bifunctional glutamine synthetase adenylyltransferase/adenylyl-removing enzyme n=1 Tax=Vespertiliibacter pulmonis TaxID=1443036 RepID=A0A3N4VRN6_9PAST|nr:bifunctional [glutamate--ammonia ligase]-adenylyl-L-tyrosine phosphorylase/[glutamate--ammonia-ligase] adenylyltransferase [Vespertiliibacter pulmonis]QLB21346.1 bifunctional glutamine synthetase adenylyltransferase/deadenyltransferase [Vespertiliibacter pulmonis]RPE85756.1 glutamate-ammonia-ligase adenylyltransferase [Vespertiliibacter pulmonis]
MCQSLLSHAKQTLNELIAFHSIPTEFAKNSCISPLVNAIALSDFVAKQLYKQPELLQKWLIQLPNIEDCQFYLERLQAVIYHKNLPIETEVQLQQTLRQFRHTEMVILSFLQSNRLATPKQIFERLSDLAEALVLTARDWLFHQLCREYGTPVNSSGEVQELLILGMGKLGGRELNFSSDIDLIFTYPDAGETQGGRKTIENSKFFTRLGQRLIRVLDEITLDGQVYRIDMRLRPFGESGALVLSFSAMEDYYQEQGRDWERYAMIKAKILGEDEQNPNHRYLKSLLRPFIYRRYLDFSAIQSLREMKQKISREVRRQRLEDNIKLGAGGIREIEFIVQAFQLMRGGRDKILQQRSLLAVLPQLVSLNLLTQTDVSQLRNAYLFLRHTENILQAIDDQQTQTLPNIENENDRLRICIAFGCQRWSQFTSLFEKHRQNVSRIFNALIGGDETEYKENEQPIQLAMWSDILHHQISLVELNKCLADYSIDNQDIPTIFNHFSATFQGWLQRPIGVRGRAVLQKLLPIIVDRLFKHQDYLLLLPRILNIMDKIITRTTYLELLFEKEQILPKLFTLCSQSIMIAEQIARYPMLLDELLLSQSLTEITALDQYSTVLREYLLRVPENDEEALLDALRQFKQSQLLRISAVDILGSLPIMKISDHLTALAEAVIGEVVNIAWKQLSNRFGSPEHLEWGEQDFVVIGYGKLGGIELGYNSDLDLVFLHNAPENSVTLGGKKSISSHQFYLKLAQKINSIFNVNTSAGVLYEIDMRLRPSGEAGLLVSTFNAYEQYQHNEAWTWESQALVRARAVYGTPLLCEKFEQIRREVLTTPRSSGQLANEICQMRKKMYQHLSQTKKGAFHLKQDCGGITDIEFIAQFLVLNNAHQQLEMAVWSDNVRIFDSAMESCLLCKDDGELLKQCYIQLRTKIHQLNLLNQELIVSDDEFVAEREIVKTLWHKIIVSVMDESE